MTRGIVVSPDGKQHVLIGITRAEFESMIGQGTICLELSDYVGKYEKLFIIGGETEESIQKEIDSKMKKMEQA
jgi:hypothetical protein